MLLAARPVGESHLDPLLLVLNDIRDVDIAAQFRMWILLQVLPQQGLEFGLVEHVRLREPVDALSGIALKLGQQAQIVVDQPQPHGRSGDRAEFRADSQARNDAVDLVVQVHGPRLRIGTHIPVQHEAPNPVLSQQGRHRDPCRTGTDDDYRDDSGVLTVMWVPQRRSDVLHGVALLAEVDSSVIGRDSGLDDVAVMQVFRVLGLALEKCLPLHRGR